VSLEVDRPEPARHALEALPFVASVKTRDGALDLAILEPERHVAEIVDAVRAASARVISLRFRKPTLEDVFLQLTGHAIRDPEEQGDRSGRRRSGERKQ
jgi:ABC-2 type transport system ATP-binding protein